MPQTRAAVPAEGKDYTVLKAPAVVEFFSFFCPGGAGRYGALSDGCMITLRTPDLNVIRTKHRSVGLSAVLTGWASGLMQRGPLE